MYDCSEANPRGISYDTVNFILPQNQIPGVNLIKHISTLFDGNDIESESIKGGELLSRSGIIGGLKVSVSRNAMNVKGQSLSKWYIGNNLQAMSIEDTQRAIERISDVTHLDFCRAIVNRIDVAQNFIMEQQPCEYFKLLGMFGSVEPSKMRNGVYYYIGQDTVLAFYDKYEEILTRGRTGENIPKEYEGKNLLRFEKRYLRRVRKQLKWDNPITANVLYDRDFYTCLLQDWGSSYNQIQKINNHKLSFKDMVSSKDFKNESIVYTVNSLGGYDEAIKEVNEARERGELTRKQAHDRRKLIEKAFNAIGCKTVTNSVICELDQKIKEAMRIN